MTLHMLYSMHWFPSYMKGHLPCQLVCTLTSPLDWAWKTNPYWPLKYWNPSTGEVWSLQAQPNYVVNHYLLMISSAAPSSFIIFLRVFPIFLNFSLTSLFLQNCLEWTIMKCWHKKSCTHTKYNIHCMILRRMNWTTKTITRRKSIKCVETFSVADKFLPLNTLVFIWHHLNIKNSA